MGKDLKPELDILKSDAYVEMIKKYGERTDDQHVHGDDGNGCMIRNQERLHRHVY